jgi:hypothetical protein
MNTRKIFLLKGGMFSKVVFVIYLDEKAPPRPIAHTQKLQDILLNAADGNILCLQGKKRYLAH